MDFALNNLQKLICHKNPTNQLTNRSLIREVMFYEFEQGNNFPEAIKNIFCTKDKHAVL